MIKGTLVLSCRNVFATLMVIKVVRRCLLASSISIFKTSNFKMLPKLQKETNRFCCRNKVLTEILFQFLF